ncbi:Carboxylesterase type B, conserved site,Carboxylesterase, type B,Carboxylesterase type B [Cinara cedri]|uniref:Carboxylic ester hydrolase n=1 Tax=Cinara cedri TaxID=506608 RepID=A0A5E4NEL5_9HEMI|nr:Carboxylesterase type B, conserved site,Carboxylesterase, type B,Carboxylesterase type B [Cinara cedri]
MRGVLLVMFVSFFRSAICTGPLINIHYGQLKGKNYVSRSGRNYFAFQGIPYAKPPVGNLRFKPPEPASSWNGILNATVEPPACIQKNMFMYQTANVLVGSEDCLYLNVYTPKLPKIGHKNLPVMVWIPGGGFSSGHGGMRFYGPKYLMDKDVILVTMNYRLGVFGFLSTEDDVLPGNYGLKDQVAVLHWVQENIAKFGGDKKKVTLFGESAGGASVGLHLLSPMSKGLFHKAILQSGSPFCLWAVLPPGLAERRAKAASTIMGCPSNSKDMIDCLRLLPAETLVNLPRNFCEWEIHPSVTFSVVAEKCHKNNKHESFLCNYPLKYYKQVSLVPTIIGMNTGEGGLFASWLYDENGIIRPELKNNFNRIVPLVLQYHFTASYKDVDFISNKIKEHYFPKGISIEDNPKNTVDMISGGAFLKGVIDMAQNIMSPARFYVYDYANKYSLNAFFGPCPKNLGVSHGDEMISLFDCLGKKLNEPDTNVSKLLVNIWTYFASSDFAEVTIDGTSTGNIWPVYDKKDMKYLLIKSPTPVLAEKPFEDEYNFWSSLPLMSDFQQHVLKTEL